MATLLVFGSQQWFEVELSPEVASALVTVGTFALGYQIREEDGES